MEHLEFLDKLNGLGYSIKTDNPKNEVKVIEIPNMFNVPDFVEIKNLKCNYTASSIFSRPTPLQAIISKAIDIDEWKHSWHYEIKPENFEKFREIIQDKILKRAKEIDFLLTVYRQLNYEMSDKNTLK